MKTVTVDPVCGMDVDESSELRAEHEGTTYLFCSEKCRQRFLRDPEEFTERRTRDEQSAETGSGKKRQKGRGSRWTDYIPLIVIVALTFLAACGRSNSPIPAHGMAWRGCTTSWASFSLSFPCSSSSIWKASRTVSKCMTC